MAARCGQPRGTLSRWLLPYDNNTSVMDQGDSKAFDSGDRNDKDSDQVRYGKLFEDKVPEA